MNTFIYSIIFFFLCCTSFAQVHNFENSSIPETLTSIDGKSKLELSDKYFKDGKQSLHWKWTQPNAVLKFSDAEINSTASLFNRRSGLKIWIFNEQPKNKPLTFNFKDEKNSIKYTFNFNLNFTGWRAGWIAFSDMWTPEGGETQKENVVMLEIVSPNDINAGELWLDRIEFADNIENRVNPDAQIPYNNRFSIPLNHWASAEIWERFTYDIPLPSKLTKEEEADLAIVYNNVKNEVKGKSLTSKQKEKLADLIELINISDDGLKGAPLLQKDYLEEGDVHYTHLNDLIDLSARSWYIDKDKAGKSTFIKAIKYMLNQGFAYGSGMGTNHHYGYNIRDMAGAIWWMEDVLRKENLWEDARDAIIYWGGLQETRLPFDEERRGTTDTWNTLLITRLTSAMLLDTKEERFRAITGLSRWVNGSIRYTSGTIGGIKVDGTSFHHGGHYPAYSVPGFASIGSYLELVNETRFSLDERSRDVFKFALLSLARQTNLRDWGLGVSGRHPFHAEGNGNISKKGVQAFAHAAQAFSPIDRDLAGHYLRLIEGLQLNNVDKKMINLFTKEGIEKADNPSGFYVYNYASQGIYRYKDKMIVLKGFTNNIWGSELYRKDNRYGRYQSYGSVQIIGTPSPKSIFGSHPITEEASRFTEAGWNWNRNPGTTTIHLPFDQLESPFKGSDMLTQPESFAGASQLENGKYGMFAMKLGELKRKNFTPSFKAHKSVFCFDNKIICLGSNITNENSEFETETTLFQQNLLSESEKIEVNGKSISQFPFSANIATSENNSTVLKDVTGYYYYLPGNQKLSVEKKKQDSFENKNKKPTTGIFASAYINHDKAPSSGSYEYMILIDPTKKQLGDIEKDVAGYEVLLNSKAAHIVKDVATNTRGYAIFESLHTDKDDYILESDAELMIMLREEDGVLNMSICNPDLNLGEYTYTTTTPSQPILNKVVLKGKYFLSSPKSNIVIKHTENNTEITTTLQDGIPLNFSLSSNTL